MFTVRPTVGAESQEARKGPPAVDGLIRQSHRVVPKKSHTGHINTGASTGWHEATSSQDTH